MSLIKSAVIGVGYLGNFHAQKFAMLPNTELVGVCDIDHERATEIANQLNTKAFKNYRDLLGQVDAVSIAVPTAMHFEIARDFLSHGAHVLLEKPMTSTLEQAEQLINLARKHQKLLQIGHLERFNPVLNALDAYLDNPRFIESTRLASFKPRGTDINVVLDLMIHDIEIIQRIVGAPIVNISANGAPVLTNLIDIANARIEFANGCVANVTASRVSFKNERTLRIFQPSAYLRVDMQNKQLAVYRKGVSELFPGIPDITSEQQIFDQSDALLDQIKAFLTSIETNSPAAVTGEDGKAALATAIHITQIVRDQMDEFQRSEMEKRNRAESLADATA